MQPEVHRLTLPYRALDHEVLLIAVPRGAHILAIQPAVEGFMIHVVADNVSLAATEHETVRIAVVRDGRPYTGPELHGTHRDGRLYGYIGFFWLLPKDEHDMQAVYFFEIGRTPGAELPEKEAQTP